MKRTHLGTLLALLFALQAGTAADLKLASILGDHMVLQRNTIVHLWGWSTPGETVTVTPSWNGHSYTTVTAPDGKWLTGVETTTAGGPYKVTVASDTVITLNDVLLGEVWICSGQSNMAWTLSRAQSAGEEIPRADFPRIRLFTVERRIAARPKDDVNGRWTACSPESAKDFSAVGYFFGKNLHRELDVPVGLVHTSWGGTPSEAWTSKQTLQGLRDFDKELQQLCMLPAGKMDMAQSERDSVQALIEQQRDFMSRSNVGLSEGWMRPDYDDTEWKSIPCPAEWSTLPEVGMLEGVAWMRKRFEIPPDWTGRPLVLELGPVDEMDATYVNGQKVGSSTEVAGWDKERIYRVPAAAVTGTDLLLAIRIVNTVAEGGLFGDPAQLRIYPEEDPGTTPVLLAGDWKFRVAYDFPQLPTLANPRTPSVLYNAMLHPLTNFAIRGAIWYQGEANVSRAYQYREIFPAMIRDWRASWGLGDFPFYFVQLAPFRYGYEFAGAELREAQFLTLDRVSNTGMAVTLDIGNPDDIHPGNKRDVGKRLALWALAKTYGRQLVYSGPLYTKQEIEGSSIRVFFDHTGSGLDARGGALTGFEMAGSDGLFLPADALIDGETVIVSQPEIENPVAVRYGWRNTAEPNLFNKEGLPASSFNTGNWNRVTEGRR